MGAGLFPETVDCPAGDSGLRRGREGGVSAKPPSLSFHHTAVIVPSVHDPADGRPARLEEGGLETRGRRDLLPVRPASPADSMRRGPKERDWITMANDANCPTCHRVSLVHTGAFWTCPRCGLMVTKHALAAEIMQAGREDRPGEDGTERGSLT